MGIIINHVKHPLLNNQYFMERLRVFFFGGSVDLGFQNASVKVMPLDDADEEPW